MPGQSGYAVGWGTLALINAGLAQGRQRSGLYWFAVSLVLGPLATLLIVVLPAPTKAQTSMDRAQWIIAAIVLLAFVLAVVGLLAFGMAAAPHVGGG
jgi:hypothetical protein